MAALRRRAKIAECLKPAVQAYREAHMSGDPAFDESLLGDDGGNIALGAVSLLWLAGRVSQEGRDLGRMAEGLVAGVLFMGVVDRVRSPGR